MVEQRHTVGERKNIVLSGSSFLRRFTRLISVPMAHAVPGGADFTVLIIYSVDPHRSDSSTTSLRHSGWTIMFMPGCFSLKYSICFGRNSMWTLQNPSHRISLAFLIPASLFPPLYASLCQTIISSSGIPVLVALFLPRCSSGKNKTFLRSPSAHLTIFSAEDDVHMAPPFFPQNAFKSSERIIYVTGSTFPSPATLVISFHAFSTLWRSAMSAIEQPAVRSGSS